MDNIKVSIITPSYNQGEYIEETINSVLNQSYKNIEYIIQDSCSNDKTAQILEKYKDFPNIKIYIEKDNGQSDAINRGFKKATGVLVGWINSDDILNNDSIQKIVEEYNKNKNASIFYGNIELINSNGKPVGIIKESNINYNRLLNYRPEVMQPGSIYNNEIVRNIGYLDEELHYAMDYDLWLRILKINNKAIKIDETLAKFRLHNESKTSGGKTFFKFWKDIFKVRKLKHNSSGLRWIHLYFLKSISVAGGRKVLRGIKNEK